MNNQHYERENPGFWDKKKEKDMTKDQLADARKQIEILEKQLQAEKEKAIKYLQMYYKAKAGLL